MTDINSQSPFILPGDLSKYNNNVIFRGIADLGTGTITTSGSYTYYFLRVDITQYVTTNTIPEIIVWEQNTGGKTGNSTTFLPYPFSTWSGATPTLQDSGYFEVEVDPVYNPSRVSLNLQRVFFARTIGNIYYQIKSSEPGPVTQFGDWQ